MKRFIPVIIAFLLIETSVYSQKTVFDIARFDPPSGWTKSETPDRITFTKIDNSKGTYCVLGIYKSITATGNIEADFSSDWESLVAKPLSIADKPSPSEGRSINGYTVLSGAGIYRQGQATGTALQTTMESNSKLMSIVIMTTDTSYLSDIRRFYSGLELAGGIEKKETVVQQVIGETSKSSFGDYIYSVPAGWKSEYTGNSIVLRGPDNSSVLTILPMVKAGGDLDNDMETLFFQIFPGWIADPRIPDHHRLTKGTAPSGWQYYKKEIAISKNDNRDAEIYAFVFLARIGDFDAIIAGSYVSGNDLLDDDFKTDWVVFFHNLDFRNYKGPAFNISKEIAGSWIGGGSSAITSYEFLDNGKYISGAGFSTSHSVSDYTERVTTTTIAGDGTYSVNGNLLTMTSNKTGKDRKTKIRLYYRNDYGSWIYNLGILDTSIVDNLPYEVSLVKQQ